MTILCGSDLTPACERVERIAARIAVQLGDELILTHIVEDLGLSDDALSSSLYDDHRRRLEAVAQRLRAGGLAVRTHLCAGVVGFRLPVEARRFQARLVVAGARAGGPGSNWLFDSTTARTVADSPAPVLMVREPAPIERWLDGDGMKVVLALGRENGAGRVLESTSLLRGIAAADVVVAHVVRPKDEHRRLALPTDGTDLLPAADEVLRREMADLVGTIPGEGNVDWRLEGTDDRADTALLRLAEDEAADLLVIGAGRARAWSGARWGSAVARHVVAAWTGNLLVAPPVPSTDRVLPSLRELVVASDLDHGDAAVRYAVAAADPGATVHLATVIPPPERIGFIQRAGAQDDESAMAERADRSDLHQRLLALVPSETERMGVRVQTHVLCSLDRATALLGLAERLGADLICLDASTRSRMGEALLGSTTRAVVAGAGRPVLVVPTS